MNGELENARRTINKAEQVLAQCEEFFRHQAQMNAAAHLSSGHVAYPPIYASVQAVLLGINTFRNAYPEES